jgi:hypothetical protein
MRWCLYVGACKDDDQLHIERIPYSSEDAERADVAIMLYQLDELILPQTMACVAAHIPVKIKKLQRYLEVDDV